MQDLILQMTNISKSFPGVMALQGVSVEIQRGHIHAFVGENGAGKSTLIKILNGYIKADSGTILLNGKESNIKNTLDAYKKGVSFVFQEFNLVSCLSVAENMFLGDPIRKASGTVDWNKMYKKAEDILLDFKIPISPRSIVDTLSVAEKQMLEIAKALSADAELIVMDEPTATLTQNEVERLFDLIRALKKSGKTVIYISHRLEEIFEICDMVTILRDGEVICTAEVASLSRDQIIEYMVGRSVSQEFPERQHYAQDEILRVENLSIKGKLKNISFSLKKAEILGIAGLVGAGRTELARAVFGADRYDSGKIFIKGKAVNIKSSIAAMRNGIALLPEDRKEQGLFLGFSIKWNISVSNIRDICGRLRILSNAKENNVANDYIRSLNIKTPSAKRLALFLSGGNQQKVALSKWLFAGMDILILDEPTRGIDVGAKQEIYKLMYKLVEQGKSIIIISSELPEVIALSNRVLVMNNGEIKCELGAEDITPEAVIGHAISN